MVMTFEPAHALNPRRADDATPAPFPWQAERWRECLTMQRSGRVHHAFLLRGAAGNGKYAFASQWANALVCEEGRWERRPCGVCRGCVCFQAGTHPDVRVLEPPPEKKSIGIDGVRELIEYVWLARQYADQKPVIIPGAERMTIPAANTLLKTLEEPPGNVVFILVSDRSDRLPVTVRSRCRFLDFPIPPRESALSWLTQQLPAQADATYLLEAAGGAPLLALRYGEGDTLEQQRALGDDLTALLSGKADPLRVAERWKTLGCALLLPWIGAYLTALIRLRLMTASGLPTREGRAPDAREQLARGLDLSFGYRLLDRCLDARRAWEESNSLNEALLLEGIAMDFAASGGMGKVSG
uniref:DNA-directed DNA polymerase n=1 Tax=Candidatus Kentrum sp. MB TaxID=2138164 RepID=A0A451BEX7_9GAMM|nr:MAG: DNA polymerase-3 subunit delta' [Candidatus Kentron sp. MB]VFK34629.1 MAG: DNA polymerase-3 subunit delta' [Candidatus Kentron sp. MB]VFK76833.1 MAG: DNA polymerase-3 subunit delta' [Candidatus Kentron sp. MB]